MGPGYCLAVPRPLSPQGPGPRPEPEGLNQLWLRIQAHGAHEAPWGAFTPWEALEAKADVFIHLGAPVRPGARAVHRLQVVERAGSERRRRRAHARRTRALTSTTGASFRRSRRAVGPGATLSQPASLVVAEMPHEGGVQRSYHPWKSTDTPANRTHGALYPRADVSPGLCSPIADV